jgi:hypothetical protein
MRVHIISAFYRKQLVPTLVNYFEPMNIDWYPVCDYNDIEIFKDNTKTWIHPILCPPLKLPGDQAFKKLNDFIDQKIIIDNDYYCFCGDDDMYEPGFFDVIKQQTAKIIFTSIACGDTIPPTSPHNIHPMIIRTFDDIAICRIGLPQYIIKGEILKQIRFKNEQPYDDGTFAVELKTRFPNDCIFLPDLFAFGNYFEPGRYTNDNWKLKSNWELPKII